MVPTSSPTYKAESWGEITFDKTRIRKPRCENKCSGHGVCPTSGTGKCECYNGVNGEAEWTDIDCSVRACPKDIAWVGDTVGSNDLHPYVECSNKGICDRQTGMCDCFIGYDGIACQRMECPDECNGRGMCYPLRILASKVGRKYDDPWDASKSVGCFCDIGFRGSACELFECPSQADPQGGFGNSEGRDCSGRGMCDYDTGKCRCFVGFFGDACEAKAVFM